MNNFFNFFFSEENVNRVQFIVRIVFSLIFWISSVIIFLVIIGVEFDTLFKNGSFYPEPTTVGFQIVLPILFYLMSMILFLNTTYRRLFTIIDRKRFFWVYLIGLSCGMVIYFSATEFFKYFLLICVLTLALVPNQKTRV